MAITKYALIALFFYAAVATQNNAELNNDERYLVFKNGKYGYIDANGKEVISFNYHAAEQFSNGLASVRKNGFYGYINLSGKMVINDKFDYAGSFLNNGFALVYVDKKPYVIDSKGQFAFEHNYKELQLLSKGILATDTSNVGHVLNFSGLPLHHKKYSEIKTAYFKERLYYYCLGLDHKPNKEDGKYNIDIYDHELNRINEVRNLAQFKKISNKYIFHYFPSPDKAKSNEQTLTSYFLNDSLGYKNVDGEFVWKEKTYDKTIGLNIDYVNIAYYASRKSEDNLISTIDFKRLGIKSKKKNKVQLVIIDDKSETWGKNYLGYKMLLLNHGDSSLILETQDGRLYILMQAKNVDGQWQDIEYSLSSWCGNSYYNTSLSGNCYWEFEIPKYEGAKKTQFRAKLSKIDFRRNQNMEGIIYSNEIDGTINPGQFWRLPNYSSKGLMDPYNN